MRHTCSPYAVWSSAAVHKLRSVCTCQANGFSALKVVGRLLLPGDLVLLQAGQNFAHDAGGVGLALHGQLPPPLCHQALCWPATALSPCSTTNSRMLLNCVFHYVLTVVFSACFAQLQQKICQVQALGMDPYF